MVENKDEIKIEAKKVTIDDLSNEEVFPTPSEFAIEAHTAKINEENFKEAEKAKEKVKLNKDGTSRKKRGRPRKSDKKEENKQEASSFKNPNDVIEEKVDTDLNSAIVISGLIENTSVGLISKDFQYSEIERATNVAAWHETIKHYGGYELHPVTALAASHMSIIFTRLQKSEESKTKFKMGGLWFKSKIVKFSKLFKRGKKDALSNTRENNERENNASEKESGKSAKS